jgi:alpha-amylase/alpha-mannosidase (GH57 family)
MVHVCFLWHMHQPDYRDPVSGAALMPWVRLHATRGYYDMAKSLLEAPEDVCVTINFAPSLLEQLLLLADPSSLDRFIELAHREASTLTFHERRLMLRHFFSISRETGVNPRPRYRELLEKRDALSLDQAATQFTAQELTDVAALFYLSWVGWGAREDFPRLAALEQKGGYFTEKEKQEILSLTGDAAKRVLHLYREAKRTGKIELSATPYAHPILPLLYDSDCAQISRPDLPLPPRFSYPQDARWHVQEAVRVFRHVFQENPRGMWPAEGSISPQVVPLFEEAKLDWIASDEGVLLRSIEGATREEAMTKPWRLAGSSLDVVFRDRDLSDRIGFWYSKMPPKDAAEDFLSQVSRIEEKLPQNETRILCVILDGENPWEHYPDGGRQFLSLVYRGLQGRCLGLSQALSLPKLHRGSLASLHSGSWIEASFRIWIGGEADNRAWRLLGEARATLEEAIKSEFASDAITLAHRHMAIAEGSDWFWWFGDDFASEEKIFFDALFRGRLIAVYRALHKQPPEDLLRPVEEGVVVLSHKDPSQKISPLLDGRFSSLHSWEGAGSLLLSHGRSSMFSGSEPFERLFFGVMDNTFFLRLHPSITNTSETWFEGLSIKLSVDLPTGRTEHLFAPALSVEHRVIFDEVFEAALVFSELRGCSFSIVVLRGGHAVARYPLQGDIAFRG